VRAQPIPRDRYRQIKRKFCTIVGGVVSPLLANATLDGMERLFGAEDDQAHYRTPRQRRGRDREISLIRYADDAVVTAPTREALSTYVIPKLTAFLTERGLKLSEAKTQIVHVDEGFDFLGFTVRRYHGVILTTPQKTKLVRHLRSIADYLRQHRQATPSQIICELGPVIRRWAN
jgi:RNA-directed DNA polymerase